MRIVSLYNTLALEPESDRDLELLDRMWLLLKEYGFIQGIDDTPSSPKKGEE